MNRHKSTGSPARGLAAATLGFFFASAAISLFGPSATKLMEVMNMSPSQLGLLVAIPTLSGSLLRIPLGASVDVNGGRKSFLFLMIVSIIGLTGLSILLTTNYPNNMEGTYWLILLFGCLSGFGIASFSVGAGQSSYWYPKSKQGIVLGIFAGLGNLGAGVFAIFLPLLLTAIGFVPAYYIWTAMLIIGTVIYYFLSCNAFYFQYKQKGLSTEESIKMAKDAGQELFPAGNMKESLKISAKIPETWVLLISYFVTFGGFIALTAWFPTFWQKTHGLSATMAGLYTAIFASLATVLRIPAGKLADKVGGIKMSMTALVTLTIITIIMAFVHNLYISIFCVTIIAITFGMNNASVMRLVPEYIHKSVGGASGWIGGLGAFGGFVFPPILGEVASKMGITGYYRGFLTFSVLSIISIIVSYLVLIKKVKKKHL